MIGFKFYDGYNNQLYENIFTCPGTILAQQSLYKDDYLPHAIIPIQDWHPLKKDAMREIRDIYNGDTGKTVFITTIKNPSMAKLTKLTNEQFVNSIDAREIQHLYEQALADHVHGVDWERYLGIETTKDAAPTLTWDEFGVRTGLHVDSWYGLDIAERSRSPNPFHYP